MKRKNITILAIAMVAVFGSVYAAKPKARTANADRLYEEGLEAVMLYDIEKLDDVIERWEGILKKGAQTPQELRTLQNRSVAINNMLGRVENIKVVEWLKVDTALFFEKYRLSADAGTLGGTFEETTFTPSSGTEIFYTVEDDSTGNLVIRHADILDDGTRQEGRTLDLGTEKESDKAYPFMASDGTTLYFADNADTQSSLGGYDIYMTRRDESGKYLEPTNIGMPYNSPGNDFMFVIDEGTGLGWWATDRNAADGEVSIYVFIPNENRINYDADVEGIKELAFITSPEATLPEGFNAAEYLQSLDNIENSNKTADKSTSHFSISLGNGVIYTSPSQFHGPDARAYLENYQKAQKKLDEALKKVDSMRSAYAAGDLSVRAKIVEIEKNIDKLRSEFIAKRNALIANELKR